MLKKMSAAFLAVSILAAPAFAAGTPKTAAAGPAQTSSSQVTTGIAKSNAGKPHHLRRMARHHHRMKVRSFARRHHNTVSSMHAKPRLGITRTSHIGKDGRTVSLNKSVKTAGPKLGFKRVVPAIRRG
jgi:hypothetical protein